MENENWESWKNKNKILRIGAIASSAECEMDQQIQNLLTFRIFIVIQIKIILEIC